MMRIGWFTDHQSCMPDEWISTLMKYRPMIMKYGYDEYIPSIRFEWRCDSQAGIVFIQVSMRYDLRILFMLSQEPSTMSPLFSQWDSTIFVLIFTDNRSFDERWETFVQLPFYIHYRSLAYVILMIIMSMILIHCNLSPPAVIIV